MNQITTRTASTKISQVNSHLLVIADLLQQPRHFLVLRLTLLLLLLYGASTVFLDVPLRVACSLMLLAPTLLTSQAMWVIVCGLVWTINATDWLWLDNHKILIGYWCLVCALGVSAKKTDAVLAWNGRILIGLTFLFATIWKLLAGEYGNGAFLHYTFLTDGRASAIATMIGGLSPDMLLQNQLLEAILKRLPDTLISVKLASTPSLERFALMASYWTLLIEGSITVAFICSGISWLCRYRDWLLLFFIATTYFLLPVLGFAYVLMIMGFAQCPPQKIFTRIAYLFLLGLLQLARLF
ncbi:MAG TPA: hypothetical protein ACFCUY_13000 [Xenococcaceae cyanobacterium]